MEKIEVAPCYDCGHSEKELEELKKLEHEYHLFNVFGEKIVLCDFCDADFGSYYPEYFGFPEGSPQDYPMDLIKKITEPKPSKDHYCPKCQHRLSFIAFLTKVRKKNAT